MAGEAQGSAVGGGGDVCTTGGLRPGGAGSGAPHGSVGAATGTGAFGIPQGSVVCTPGESRLSNFPPPTPVDMGWKKDQFPLFARQLILNLRPF